MRCFIAIDLPENVKENLRKIKIDEKIAKVLQPSDYHLTLKFLGEVSEWKLGRVKNELLKIRFKPFKIKLDKVGFFPRDKNFIRIIWIGIMPKRKVIDLKKSIDDALVGLLDRDKGFEPHVTLGRVKAVRDKDKFRKFFELQIERGFKVNCFKLIKSELSENGAKYEIIEEYS